MVNEDRGEQTKPQIGQWAASGIVVSLGGLIEPVPGGQALRWNFDPLRARWKTPPEDLHTRFAALWEKKDSAILSFADSWGPLRILPIDAVAGRYTGTEPYEWWRYLSHRACAVLRISKALEDGAIGADEDWGFLTSAHREDGSVRTLTDAQIADRQQATNQARFGLPEHSRYEFSVYARKYSGYRDPISYAKATIASEASAWLDQFGVKVCLQWDPKSSWQIGMSYGGRMLSAVAFQLALAIAGGGRLFTCSGCKTPYKRPTGERAPNAGHANFCSACTRKHAPEREAQRRYRENRRQARKLAAAGTTVREIADRLDRKTDVVRSWIKKDR